MFTIFRKEITGFFSSLTGYIVMIVFLLANSLIMWILPGQFNLLDSGYAGLDTLFIISPWLFLFLVPAVTMKLLAEEKRQGTLELLYSRPLGSGAIIYGKFLSAVALVLISLLPTIVFVISIWVLGETPGNFDRGATAGSFAGLFLLASVYAAIGLFASSLTENQVVAFILAVVVSLIVWIGFDSIALIPGLSAIDETVIRLGINEHYRSVSRGVIDIKDIAYFLFITVLFNEATRYILMRRKISRPATIVALMAVVSIALSLMNIRVDLSEDKRFTLSPATKKILSELKSNVSVSVYLEGEMPVGLKKLRRSTEQYLDEFRIRSGRKVSYDFINPSAGAGEKDRAAMQQELIDKGMFPVNVMAGDREGGKTQKWVFPSLTLKSGEVEIPVNFLKNDPSLNAEVNLLRSSEGLEYEIIKAIATATSDTVYRVAFIEGHGELDEVYVADLTLELAKYFSIDRGTIGGNPGIIDDYAAVVIAGPQEKIDEKDKYVIDQYIMNGGRVLWLAEEVSINQDSLAYGGTVGLYDPLSFSDQLFRYGVRINPFIIQDTECMLIPIKITGPGGKPQYVPAPWVYYPLLRPSQSSPVSRNLNRVMARFANTVDTVGRDTEIQKTILLTTSAHARTVSPPVFISLEETKNPPAEEMFTASELPVAVLLEGTFRSAFTNRMTDNIIGDSGYNTLTISKPTKMIVIADADIIRNEVSWSGGIAEPLPLGQDRYTQQTYGNKDFLVNCLNYLVYDDGLMELRSREIKPRLLDRYRTETRRAFWQTLNTIVPVFIIVIAGVAFTFLRRRKYNSVK